MQLSATLTVMVQAARKAARGLQRDFGEVENLQVSRKGPGDFVTAADLKAEKILREELAKARPGYSFLLEEAGEVKGSDKSHRWIIDPLDGTTNFMHGIPVFAISIALERAGEVVAGLVYNPVTDEMFLAEKGRGAFLNNRRLRVAARTELADAVICTGIPHLGRASPLFLPMLSELMPRVAGIRRTGSAALDLAYVAAGRFDGFWEAGLAPWDMAAGVCLIREAGGTVSDLSGKDKIFETGGVLTANERLHGPLLDLLKKARKSAASNT
ncbi:inositol monophosphatase family protein [Tepidicaulis sp.]|uniref:inositol monophosphatase family protein n=1 Tax=Tepidicaulis sp. TaxID=1920809 RepID=UPI003B5A31B5